MLYALKRSSTNADLAVNMNGAAAQLVQRSAHTGREWSAQPPLSLILPRALLKANLALLASTEKNAEMLHFS